MLKAGFSRIDITASKDKTNIIDPVFAKALVISDEDTIVAIVSMDAVAIGRICDVDNSFLPNLRNKVEGELGIKGKNVLVNATHTHTLPPMLCESTEQLNRTFTAIKEAYSNMIPVTFGASSVHDERYIINRTMRLKNGKGYTIRNANPCPKDDEISHLGEVDSEIGIWRFDRLDGTPFTVLINYGCHPLAGEFSNGVSAKYPGVCERTVETAFPNANAMFVQGSGGDVCELYFKDNHTVDAMRTLGTTLGLSVVEAVHGIKTSDNSRIHVVSETVKLPKKTNFDEQINNLKKEQQQLLPTLRTMNLNWRSFLPLYIQYSLNPEYPADYAYRYLHQKKNGQTELIHLDEVIRERIDKYLHNIGVMERLTFIQDTIETLEFHKEENNTIAEPDLDCEIMGIKIGDSVLISSPVEMLSEVALSIKSKSPKKTFIAAFSNGYLHYGAPESDYALFGYETVECMLDSGWRKTYEENALKIIGRLTNSIGK